MDRLASVPNLSILKKRSRSSLPRISSPKKLRVEDWIEGTVASQQSSSRTSRRRLGSDSAADFSVALERQNSITARERPQLTKGILGPTVSDLPSDPEESGLFLSTSLSIQRAASDKSVEPTDLLKRYYI